MDLWPYNQGTVPAACMEKYWPTSWTGIVNHQDKIQKYRTPKFMTIIGLGSALTFGLALTTLLF